ncbi:HSP90 family protein [Galactobacter caseinivorans]|uniref:HSP90 family protein n=1 Tax=Galactobacter caseinivorans TaxID=2676123 RepID=A0A496PGY9_9MICC|nr:HSP90 family protein [Galactobacter caseinivorans]RKW69748.1 HSP90 family protein [Galactobacter caseinivorans]
MTDERFLVDLRGLVDILSHHLYSSPRVYLRELIQNARDAVIARHELALDSPEEITIAVDEGSGAVVVRDQGIGLTEEEMRDVLATIGASSKREDFAQTRRKYLGQFGIGLLSCFLIADRIEVRSRSARTADAPTISWVGSADGTFTIRAATEPLAEPGTEVRVQARPDDREWTHPHRVRLLAERFAGLLDLPVVLHRGPELPTEVISQRTLPWQGSAREMEAWSQRELGFRPLAILPIAVPAAGVQGLAFVAGSPGQVGSLRGDTVYSRGMFVTDSSVQLVPTWAYFVRLVIDAGDLPLTASREALQDSATVDAVKEQIGMQIREGIERFAATDPAGFARFLDVHAKGLMAMAVSDDDMLELVSQSVQWETNQGDQTLVQMRRSAESVQYTTSMTDYTAFAPLLAARGTLLVNASYVYGHEIMRRLVERPLRGARLRAFDTGRFVDELSRPLAGDTAAQLLQEQAGPVLRHLGVALDLREFAPVTVPVLYVGASGNPDFDYLGDGHTDGDDAWGELLGELVTPAGPVATSGPRLIVNVGSTSVRALGRITDRALREEAIAGLYVIGRLTAGERLQPEDAVLLNRALQALLTAAGAGGGE